MPRISATYIPPDKKKNKAKSHHVTGTAGFVCVDGEGITDPNGDHQYVLFGVGQDQIENENGLDWEDILEFLYDHYEPGIAFTGFYLSYDFDRWLRTMPEKRVERLLTNEGRESRKSTSKNLHGRVLPVDMPRGWQVNMLGKKMFEFRRRSCHCDILYCKHPKGPWMRICDAGPFFQTSLLKAIDPKGWREPIVTAEEYETLKKGKEGRADATCIDDDMRFYNRLENEVLARLLNVLNMGFKEMGITLAPGQWYGPGQAAQKWLTNNKIPKAHEILESVPQWFLEAARMSYFGGWFEIMMHGTIPGEVEEYDINSAYPYIISSLPCLLHGSYDKGIGNTYKSQCGPEAYTLVRASLSNFRKAKPAYIGVALHRDKAGRIHRPTRSNGWYWLHEITSAKRAGLIRNVYVHEWVSYNPCNCRPPLHGVRGLYDLRTKVGKDTPMGKGAKLAYNSMYGKFAQSVGNPVFANPVYASLITAGCRSMINDAIATHPKGKSHVAMVATDAVFFVTPHNSLPISERLGDWDHKPRRNLSLFKPGVYWDDKARENIRDGRSAAFKARGIAAKDFSKCLAEIDSQFEIWQENPPSITTNSGDIDGWPRVKFTTGFAMVSCLQAIRRRKWYLAGQVSQSQEMVQNANPYDKRIGAWPDKLDDGRTVWRSEPWTLPLDNCASVPYQKRFGMEDPWSLERREEYGISPDGTVPDLINGALYDK